MDMPPRFSALSREASHKRTTAAMVKFLTEIWDYHPRAYTLLYTRAAGTEDMRPHPIRGDRTKKITELIDRCPCNSHDIYFCPNSFDRPYNQKDRALPTRYAWADIDATDPAAFNPEPNILWETSAGRYQGLWIWRDTVSAQEAESYSEALWNLYGGDRGAWAANKLLRVPGTVNHKPTRNGEIVRLVHFDNRPKRLPDAVKAAAHSRRTDMLSDDIDPFKHDPEVVMRRYRSRMGLVPGTFMRANRVTYHDRSGAVAAIIAKLVELGASNDEIASVLWVNVYFNSKWPQNLRELERQILKIRGDVEAGR